MMKNGIRSNGELVATAVVFVMLLTAMGFSGCARLPYTTKVVQEDQRVAVMLQQEVDHAGYSHPTQLTAQELMAVLRGFSLREQQRLPLRWFAEEAPPQQLFREDELQALAPALADALQKASPGERVHFEVYGPGNNPRYRRDVIGGWMAVRPQGLHLTIDHFHVQQPLRKSDLYDYNYPTPPYPPKSYLLFFEPGRFYVAEPKTGERLLDLREFLKSAPAPRPQGAAPTGVR